MLRHGRAQVLLPLCVFASALFPGCRSTSQLSTLIFRVRDPIAVNGSHLAVRNVASGALREVYPNREGRFTVSGLASGRYRVTFVGAPFREILAPIDVGTGEISSMEIPTRQNSPQFSPARGCSPEPVAPDFPRAKTPVEITERRRGCHSGKCWSVSLSMRGDGTVHATMEPAPTGTARTMQVTPSRVLDLLTEFYDVQFFDLCDRYGASVGDDAASETSVRIGDFVKTVSVETDLDPSPPGVPDLDRDIESMADGLIPPVPRS